MDIGRQPKRKAIIRSLIRKHTRLLNQHIHSNEIPLDRDDFILYAVPDKNCSDTTVFLLVNDAFFTAVERWVGLIIRNKPYLISRIDCTALRRTDNKIEIDIHSIMNIPEEEEDEMVVDTVSDLTRSTGSLTSSLQSSYANQNSFVAHHNDTLIRPMRKKYSILVDTPYQLFSPARHIKEGGLAEPTYQNDDKMLRYIKCVIDYALIAPHFVNTEHRFILENKHLAYYNNVLVCNNEHAMQPPLFFEFMLNVILRETHVVPLRIDYFDTTSIRYEYRSLIKWPLMDECIEWELFRFRRSRDTFEPSEFQQLIDDFLQLIQSGPSVQCLPLPEWTYYRITGNCYWDGFTIRFEWIPLLVTSGFSTAIHERIHNGIITLSREEFNDYFLPCLYRVLLTDSFRYLWMLRLTFRDDPFTQSLSNIAYDNFDNVPLPSLVETEPRFLLAYVNTGELGALESPITKILAKRELLMPRRTNQTSFILTREQAEEVSVEVDIEELNDYLPLCLKPFLKKKVHLQNMDRVSAVSYLIDMGYQMNDVPRLLNDNGKQEIVSHYRSLMKRRNDPRKVKPGALTSLCCNAWFTIDGSKGHTIRCPYEKKANGNQRKTKEELTDEEKKGYRAECAATLGPTNGNRIGHPIEYVRHKIREMS